MTTDELYDMMKREFDEIKETLKNIDERLRNVETDVAEIKGRRLAIKDWLVIIIAFIAVAISALTYFSK